MYSESIVTIITHTPMTIFFSFYIINLIPFSVFHNLETKYEATKIIFERRPAGVVNLDNSFISIKAIYIIIAFFGFLRIWVSKTVRYHE